MKVRIFLFLAMAVASLVSCDKDNESIDDSVIFSYQRSGGWSRLDEKLSIAKDNTKYSIEFTDLQTGDLTGSRIGKETSAKVWNQLIKSFDLETFKKIQNGPCYSCVDGDDEKFIVTIHEKEYSFYNGNNDENYKQMQAFFDAMMEQVKEFYYY